MGRTLPEIGMTIIDPQLTENNKGFFDSIMLEKGNESFNLPREYFDEVYIPDGYVDIVKRSFVTSMDSIHGDKMLGFESPEDTTEVDSISEFEYIQYQTAQKKSSLLDYLNQH